jgi:hemin uptake protein HemP
MPPLTQSPARAPAAPGQPDLPKVASRDLLKGSKLVLIEHGGDCYYLRMTRNNKLILTK